MHKPNAIGWFDLYVDDMDRATVFYETVLQRRLAPIGDPTGETVMNSYGAGGALVRSPYGRPGSGGTLIYFSVEDCAAEAGRVASAGGRVLRPKFSIGEFGWVALCADTEGNVFGLSSLR
jgi:predicted enzyme related to lactoylglutathione lyase